MLTACRPFYSADWGDYVSFARHMRDKAEAQGQDLLVIETGDRVEGNGLWDSSEPKGVYVSEILRQQPVDVMTVGNHELYKQETSETELFTTVRDFRGHYLASNVDIVHPVTRDVVPLAPRYKTFRTEQQGIRIVAFGFIFDFDMNCNNTVVQPVEETVREEWFQEAIREADVDLFLVAGHLPVRSREATVLFQAIRSVRWEIPIQVLGGHFHIRDYVQYDDRAAGLASGRFMETIGFVSIDGLSTSRQAQTTWGGSPQFRRRYIDNNLRSFYQHTGLDKTSFPTEHGRNTSELIRQARRELSLDRVYGCSPRNLWMSRVPYPSNDSIYTWLAEQVIPETLKDDTRKGKPALVVANTGAIRFDLFQGPFTQDSRYILSPFTNGFRYLADVPLDKAQLLVDVLNDQPKIVSQGLAPSLPGLQALAPPEQAARTPKQARNPLTPFSQQQTGETRSGRVRIYPGYTTTDDAGVDGDDTVHSPISSHTVPNCIQAVVSDNPQPLTDTVDLVYVDFIERFLVQAARVISLDVDVRRDSKVYMPGMGLSDLITDWVRENWPC